jgi:hypothetical protein
LHTALYRMLLLSFWWGAGLMALMLWLDW